LAFELIANFTGGTMSAMLVMNLGPYATPTLRESRTNQGLSSPAKTVDIADLPRNCSVIIRPTERLMTEVQEPAQGNGFSVAF